MTCHTTCAAKFRFLGQTLDPLFLIVWAIFYLRENETLLREQGNEAQTGIIFFRVLQGSCVGVGERGVGIEHVFGVQPPWHLCAAAYDQKWPKYRTTGDSFS